MPDSPSRAPAVIGTALFVYGLLTLGAWLFAVIRAQWTSPLLLWVASPCGPLAMLAGRLLARRSPRARLAVAAWALSLLVLNAAAVLTIWPDRWLVLVGVAVPLGLVIGLLLRPPGAGD